MHTFQKFELEKNPDWYDLDFVDKDNIFFIKCTSELETLFDNAVETGSITKFILGYLSITKKMAIYAGDYPLLPKILSNSLERLIKYYYFLKNRDRTEFNREASVYSWVLNPDIIQKAKAAADVMEVKNIEVGHYDLDSDPALKNWLKENVQPIIESYLGFKVCCPKAHIRFADASKHSAGWEHLYNSHPYEYFHLDEECYSFPLIIYLDNVNENNGPFSFVQGTDKEKQNYILRAFHQAVYHHCKVNYHSEGGKEIIAGLPSVFRGGDLIGTYTGEESFADKNIVRVTGEGGKATLFEGFMLVHEGGHPKSGSRKALFATFRFPRKKIRDSIAKSVRVASNAYTRLTNYY